MPYYSSEFKKKFVIYFLNSFILCPFPPTKMSVDVHVMGLSYAKVSQGGVNLCLKNKHYTLFQYFIVAQTPPVIHIAFFRIVHLSHNTFYRLDRTHLFMH